jgi:hypothetical protein
MLPIRRPTPVLLAGDNARSRAARISARRLWLPDLLRRSGLDVAKADVGTEMKIMGFKDRAA